MNNKELQAAIDSLLHHVRSGTSYTAIANKFLEELLKIQLERSNERVE